MKQKLFLIMLLLGAVYGTSAAQLVNFSGKNVPIQQAFDAVEKQTGYVVFANRELFAKLQPITVVAKDIPLRAFLQALIVDQPLEFKISDKTIFFSEKARAKELPADTRPAANNPVSGKIKNEQGESMNGANILIKSTGRGTVANAEGMFKFADVKIGDILIVSYAGYETQQIKVTGSKELSIVMKPAVNDLDKVVVRAYGTTTQRLATGNIGTLSAKEIEKHPVMNVLQALQGQVAGAVITNNNGYASGGVKVEIRGRNTIGGNFSGDPLYIIDGVPLQVIDREIDTRINTGSNGLTQTAITNTPAGGQSPLFSLNPTDIESVEVLKDADATAIYGSRAANGVILITTKSAKAGKAEGQVSAYTGYSEITKYYQMLNTEQYIKIRKEAFANDGIMPGKMNGTDLLEWDQTRYTDWQKMLFANKGKILNAQASLSKGDKQTSFRVSAGYAAMSDVLVVSGGNYKGSINLNLKHRSKNDRFGFSTANMFSYASIDLTRFPADALYLPPNAPDMYDAAGNLNYLGWGGFGQSRYPFGVLLQPYNSKTSLLNSSMKLDYTIMNGLVARVTLGYNNALTDQRAKMPIAAQFPTKNVSGTLNLGNTSVTNIIVEPQIEYNQYVGVGKLNVLVGTTAQKNRTNTQTIVGANYTSDLMLNSINNAKTKGVSEFNEEYKYQGVFARIGYNLMDKYLLSLNGRRDGSTKFGPGRKFGNFGSVAAAWIFTEEKWLQDMLPVLSFGKLRASYGITGGDEISNYKYLRLWNYQAEKTYNGSSVIVVGAPSDSLLQWQVNKKIEVNLSFGLLKDRITFDVSWYRNRCDNQLVAFPMPLYGGGINVTTNSPANVQNTGFEFNLMSKIISKQNFRWDMKSNLAINRNKLLSYPNFANSPYVNTLKVGHSLSIQQKLHSTGVDPKTGAYTFEDVNHSGSIERDVTGKTIDDRIIYDMAPKFDGGFNTELNCKQWGLSLFFYFKKQLGNGSMYNTSPGTSPGTPYNQSVSSLDYWKKEGDVSRFGKLTTSTNNPNVLNFYAYSDFALNDASFIRMQNVSFSYSIPGKTLAKLKLQQVRMYIQCENLFVISGFDGLDPEVQKFGAMPKPRVLTAGITCNL